MMDFYETVLDVLKQDDRFFAEDGTFLRNAVYEAAMQMDADLISLLLSEDIIRERLFKEVEGVYVFDKVRFGWIVNNRQFLPDSYTRFKNKIGLADSNDSLLHTSDDVALIFPYGDCVLEGGQTKEDQLRDEVFFNMLLAPDEVDRILYPKVFTLSKRYDDNGDHEVTAISEDDNLIIKGNNLLALTSLVERYEGKVKSIYIDPPYYFSVKKDEDTFDYNSNFKLSTWLVFMKNRLEIARRLLSDDGAIFVQISDDGVAELHRLMKDIFNRNNENNFINKITVKTKSPSGFASVNPGVFETAEYIIGFAKHKKMWKYNAQYVKSEYDSNYKWVIDNPESPYKDWTFSDIKEVVAQINSFDSAKEAKKELGEIVWNDLIAQYALENADRVFRYTVINDNASREAVEIRDVSKNQPEKIYEVKRDGSYTVYVNKGQEMAFYSKKLRNIDGEMVPSMQLTNIWTDTPYEGIAKEGGVKLKGGKKPEKLIRRIVEMSTNPGDLFLDYHVGSGTSAAVAHKLGRKYIAVEQLDSQIDKTLDRMRSVIDGDKTGISKVVDWKGGGSFIYCELKEQNQSFVREIETSTSDVDLTDICSRILQSGFLSHKILPSAFSENADDFNSLSTDDKKRFLMELLDKNLLYVNYCDIDDEDFDISEADKAFTKSFYGEE